MFILFLICDKNKFLKCKTINNMNSTPLSTIFEGDVTVGLGSDVTQFGYGDLYVNRSGSFFGTEDSTAPYNGTLISYGGLGVKSNAQFGNNINVLYGTSYLTSTMIDTTNGMVSITGGNKVYIQVGDDSQFITTAGTLNLSSLSKDVSINGGLNGIQAISLSATDPSGGVWINSGRGIGAINVISGAGGISLFSSSGNMNLTCNNSNTNIINNTLSDNQNLVIGLNNATDSQLLIQSEGSNVTNTAILINTSNIAGNIMMSNYNGLGIGSIGLYSGSGGINLQTNSGGNMNIITQAGDVNFLLNSYNNSNTMTIGVTNTTGSVLLLTSSGINTRNKDALQITTTNTAGNISIYQVHDSVGAINIAAGRGGFNTQTQIGGSITMNAHGNTSLYTNSTSDDYQDLTVSVTGNTQSKVNIISEGTTSDAININSTGGIYALSNGPVSIQSNNLSNGIQIGTNVPNIPVQIGTANSQTTIFGNLDVKGVTTSIESVNVTINDNIIIVNNGPSGTANGGLGVKRWQPANNTGIGDVVVDAPDETGVLNNTNTTTSVMLPMTSSARDDYYKDWWINLTSGTGRGQVRKIKSYDGSTKIATIYSTNDQTDPNVLNNTVPVEGMDFLTVPDTSTNYALYPCGYEFMIWNEFTNQFEFGCSPNASNNRLQHFADIQINNLTANNINANTINNSTADIITTITLTNNSTTPVPLSSFTQNYGIYFVMVEPVIPTGAYALFSIGRNSYSGNSGVVARLTSVKGVNNEQLDIQWPANDVPYLLYRPSKGINGTSQYTIKIITV
jgi:hypothetical protein